MHRARLLAQLLKPSRNQWSRILLFLTLLGLSGLYDPGELYRWRWIAVDVVVASVLPALRLGAALLARAVGILGVRSALGNVL